MLAFYRGGSRLAKLIRWITWGDYAHVSYVRDDLSLELQSWFRGGVQASPIIGVYFPGADIDLYDVALTDCQRNAVEHFINSQLGKKYDWRGVLHFITRRREKPKDQDRWFCSELIAAAFELAGVPLLDRVPAYKVSPGALVRSPLLHYRETKTAPISGPLVTTGDNKPCA